MLHRFLRQLVEQPRRLAVGVLGALLMIGLVAGWNMTPGLMAEELAERLEDRFGLDLELDDLEVGRRSVVLSEITLISPEGDLELKVDRLHVVGDLVALAQREDGALERVRVHGAQATFDLDHPAAAERVAAWRRLLGSEEGEGPGSEVQKASDLGSIDRLMRLLQDDARIEVAEADLRLIEKGEIRTLLEVESSRAIRRGEREFELAGAARHDEGEFDWDLRADLALRSAYGTIDWSELPLSEALRRLPELPIHQPEAIRSSGHARLRAEGQNRLLTVEGHTQVTGLQVDSRVVALQPVRDLSLRAEGSAVLDLSKSHLQIEDALLSREEVEATLDATGSWAEGLQISIKAELPSTGCQAWIQALPADLIGDFSQFEMGGELAGRMDLQLDTNNPKATELNFDVDDQCRFLDSTPLPDPDHFRKPFEQITYGRDGAVVFAFETGPGTPAWTPIENVSPFLLQAVLASEDAGFFRHSGFAVYAMENAVKSNLRRGGFAFGASTLTMQLAKNLFLTRDKTVARKAREVLAAWWLEQHFTKRELLELYVNIVEFGPGLFGIRDAAAYYFGIRPMDLSPAESVFIASLLPSPVDRSQQVELGELWPETRRHIAWMLRHMERKNRIDTVARDHGLAQLEQFAFAGSGDRPPRTRGPEDMGLPGELPFTTCYVRHEPKEKRESWWARQFG